MLKGLILLAIGAIMGVSIALYAQANAQLTPDEIAAEPPGRWRAAENVIEAFRAGGVLGSMTQIVIGKADCDAKPKRKRCIRED
jgi:hypothetical protein